MIVMIRSLLLSCALAGAPLLAQLTPGRIDASPWSMDMPGLGQFEGERGRLAVRENRRRQDSRAIELAFLRLRGRGPQDAPPVVYLHGGPGGMALAAGRQMAPIWHRLLAHGDVVLFDQRGCGESKPALARTSSAAPPGDVLVSRTALGEHLARVAAEVAETLRAEGVDFAGYDTEQNADDVDDLRAALGYERMRLLGFSYGSHLGLAVLRRHGARVERAVLIGVEGPDHTRKLPSAYDTHIRKLSALVAADPVVGRDVPDFAGLLQRALARVGEEPLTVSIPGVSDRTPRQVRVGREGLLLLLVWDLGDTSDLVVFPRLLTEIARGDGNTLAWFVAKRLRALAHVPTLLFTMDPASGCSAARAARIADEAQWGAIGAAMNLDFPAVEALFGTPVLGDAFRRPLVCDVPTLFLSGELDANTPPYQAEEVRWGFTDGIHLVQRNGGHEDWMRNGNAIDAIASFIGGADVRGRDIDMPPLRFVPVEGEPPAGAHPALGR